MTIVTSSRRCPGLQIAALSLAWIVHLALPAVGQSSVGGQTSEMAKASQPALQKQAPYMALSFTSNAASAHRNPDRPTFVTLKEATTLGADLGEARSGRGAR
jgi:hypothetical protein